MREHGIAKLTAEGCGDADARHLAGLTQLTELSLENGRVATIRSRLSRT
ncbi:MAG: hypothetical protein SFV18_05605 [Bryobacteraceae bacterium]|nr:hypothetical protein [Bryobacteraceae bacterium]